MGNKKTAKPTRKTRSPVQKAHIQKVTEIREGTAALVDENTPLVSARTRKNDEVVSNTSVRIGQIKLTKYCPLHGWQTSLQKELARTSAKLNAKEQLHSAAKEKLEVVRSKLQAAEKAIQDAEQREQGALITQEEVQDAADRLSDDHAQEIREWDCKLESEKRQTRRLQKKLETAEARILVLEERLRTAEAKAVASIAAVSNTEAVTGDLRTQLVGSREQVRALQMKCSRADTVRENAIKRAVLKTRKVTLTYSLIKKGTYTSSARELARVLYKAGCAASKVGKAITAVARTIGVQLKHREMSRRTVLRALAEGGIAAKIQIGYEIRQATSEPFYILNTAVLLTVAKA